MSDVTEKIKERIGVAELIGEYLKLDRAGANFKALCPFHSEKTASFMVNAERNFWYCFGCQKGGDIFSFVQEIEGLSFRESLLKLADRAGIEVPVFQKQEKLNEKSEEKKIILQILEESTLFFQTQLEKSQLGQKTRKYLFQRGLTEEVIKVFRLGLAPVGWKHLLTFLFSRGYILKDIEKTGLLVKKNNSRSQEENAYYDRFRERIIFPVVDYFGQVIGFSARILPGGDEKNAKYINTPQTAVYDKSQVLYGFYQAKNEVKKQNRIILAEGNMDVVASYSAGVKNIIAISGTTFSQEQAKLIKRLTNRVFLCLDMDPAGEKATIKSVKVCLENDLETDILFLPKGNKDINDLVIKDKNSWKKISQEGAISVMDYFFTQIFEKYDKDNPREKKIIVRDLLNLIKEIIDPVEKEYWLKKLAQKTEISGEVLTNILEKVRNKKLPEKDSERTEGRKEFLIKKTENRLDFLQEQFLGLSFFFKEELREKFYKIKEDFFDGKYFILWKKIFFQEKLSRLEKNQLENFIIKARFDFDRQEGFKEKKVDILSEWLDVLENIKRERKKRNLIQLTKDIKRAEEVGDEESALLLSREYEKILEQKEEINF